MSSKDNSPSGPPAFLPISHPELRELSHKAIHLFLRERERYEMRVKEAISQGSTFQPIPLVASVDFDLLTSLIFVDTFPGVSKISELNDEVLLRWLKEQEEISGKSITLDELEILIKKNVQMRMNERDAKLRIIRLVADYNTFLRAKKFECLPTKNPSIAVRHICSLLQPPALKQKITNDLAFHESDLNNNFKEFYKYVIEKAVALAQFDSCLEGPPPPQTPRNKPEFRGKRQNYRRFRSRHSRTESRPDPVPPPRNSSTSAAVTPVPTEAAIASASASVPRHPPANQYSDNFVPYCLNQRTCPGKKHFMYQCTDSTPEEKKALLANYYKKKQQAAAAMRHVRASETELSSTVSELDMHNGRIPAFLSDSVPVTVSGDYGADHAALCDDHLEQLADANIFVPILHLQHPISMQLAVTGSEEPRTITANRKPRISTTLSTTEGPFRLRNVEYLVFNEKMPEVLLSRPLLQSLGFNLDQHLARVRAQYKDIDCLDQ